MSVNNIFQFFVPKDKKFFPLFQESTSKLVLIAQALNEVIDLPKEKREEHLNKIDELEAQIEEISHKTNLELSRNFITPFDREDIHELAVSIDAVADNMHGASSRMRLYQVEKITKSIRKLTEINLEACQIIHEAVSQLEGFKNYKLIIDSCKKLNKLESKADMVFDKAVAELFENESDVKNIIKYKEVLSSLELASDKCKNVANILEQISVKHS